MQSFLILLLTCSVSMSILSLLYMALTPFLEKRYSVKGRYYVWLVLIIGLIIPIRPQFSNSFVTVTPTETSAPVIQIGSVKLISTPIEHITPTTTSLSIPWWHIAGAVWLVGMILFLSYHAIKHYRFMKMVRRWSDPISDDQTQKMMRSLKVDLDISKPIDLFQCEIIGSPMLVGFLTPRILLPTRGFSQDNLCFILKHELVHYKRGDLWYKVLLLIASAIHWFNPVVYLMAKAVDGLCEASCDVEVIRNSDVDTRQHYSETIIGVVQYQSRIKTALATNFYGGKNSMKKRITSIMDTGKKSVGALVICAALILTIGSGAAFATNAYAATAADDSPAPGTTSNGSVEAAAQEADSNHGEGPIYTAIIALENGDELDLGEFTTKGEAHDAAKEFCSDKIAQGVMSQQEADELLEFMSQQWDSFSETITG